MWFITSNRLSVQWETQKLELAIKTNKLIGTNQAKMA